MLATILSIIVGIWVVGLCFWIILDRRSPAATLAWILALALLPVAGIAVYMFLGPRRWDKKKAHLKRARAYVKENLSAYASTSDPRGLDERSAQISEAILRTSGIPLKRASELDLYFEGADFYAALEREIAAARHHVHLEFFIWGDDGIGTRLRDLLIGKAKEGVEVRILVDAVGSKKFGRRFRKPLLAAGAEVGFFNRVKLPGLRPTLVNFRLHRKIVVVDGAVAFTGGMNIVDYHSAEFAGEDARRDTHVRVRGEVARSFQLIFLENWHFVTGRVPVGLENYMAPEERGGEHLVQAIASGPDNLLFPILGFFFSTIASARERVYLTSPYFVPNEAIFAALTTAARRGVDVRVIIPAVNDQKVVAAACRSFQEDLIRAGVRIFEYGPRLHHGKTLVVDSDVSFVGSANTDDRSFKLNFEVGLVCYGSDVAEKLAGAYLRDLESCREVRRGESAERSFPARFLESVARLFSPLL